MLILTKQAHLLLIIINIRRWQSHIMFSDIY